MAIRGITFSKQSVSSNDDSHIHKVLLNGKDGRTAGCKITHATDDIYISNGYFFASGRLVEITSAETVTTPVISGGTEYFRLVFEIDLTKINTNTDFAQGYFKVLQDAADYPEIKQEDLDDGGNVYQVPFARFTKTIAGISNFAAELETIGNAKQNTIVYVSTSGNDASGDGSEGLPFKTIQHALDSISKNLDNKAITINVASGTYSEDVEVSGFYGGTLRFEFGSVTCKTFTVYETSVILNGTSLTLSASGKTYGMYCHRGSNVICQCDLTVTGSTNGVFASYGSRFSGKNVTVNSCTNAVSSYYSAYVYISSLAGSKNNNGVLAYAGIVSLGTIATIASTLYITNTGGRIYTGAQASVPSY